METIKTPSDKTFKEKFQDWKICQEQKAWQAWEWIKANRDDLVWLVPAAVVAGKGVTKVASSVVRNHAVNKEIRYHQRTIYDRSLGRYIELRRPLTNAEALIIEDRRRNGEGLTMILQSMHLLKRR